MCLHIALLKKKKSCLHEYTGAAEKCSTSAQPVVVLQVYSLRA